MGPTGAMVMSCFAALFAAFAINSFDNLTPLFLLVPAAITGYIIFQANKLRAKTGAAANPSDTDQRAGKVILWASIGEGVGILLAVNILNNIGMHERLPAGVALVVGLHFLPMAYGIPFRPFYVNAAALIAIALIGLGVPAASGAIVVGFGAALVLWAASLNALSRPQAATPAR